MEAKDYWFSLKSHVYVEFKDKKILLYDTLNGNYIETNQEGPISLVSQIYEPQNLGVTFLSKGLQSITGIMDFIKEVQEKQMGDLWNIDNRPNKPVRLIPILNLQKDVDRLPRENEDYSTFMGKDIINYLLEVNIYLNDLCDRACSLCTEYSKQTKCCIANGLKQELSINDMENILKQICYSSVNRINILGGNILKYENLLELQKSLAPFDKIVHVYLH